MTEAQTDRQVGGVRVLRILKKALIYASLVSVALIVALFLVLIAASFLLPSQPVQSEEIQTHEGFVRSLKDEGVLDKVVSIDCERLGRENKYSIVDYYIRCEATLAKNAGRYSYITAWKGGSWGGRLYWEFNILEDAREIEHLRSE